jgi:hypothetical protein
VPRSCCVRVASYELAHEVLGLAEADSEVEAERLAFSVSPLLGRSLVGWRAARHSATARAAS